MFVDRQTEYIELQKLLDAKGFAFAVLYGRRRVGKTRLVLEALKGRNHLYYLAVEKDNLRYFSSVVAQKFPKARSLKEDWEVLLDFLKDNVDILVIDEFQNLVKDVRAVLSLFQRAIGSNLNSSDFKLEQFQGILSIVNPISHPKVVSFSSFLRDNSQR